MRALRQQGQDGGGVDVLPGLGTLRAAQRQRHLLALNLIQRLCTRVQHACRQHKKYKTLHQPHPGVWCAQTGPSTSGRWCPSAVGQPGPGLQIPSASGHETTHRLQFDGFVRFLKTCRGAWPVFHWSASDVMSVEGGTGKVIRPHRGRGVISACTHGSERPGGSPSCFLPCTAHSLCDMGMPG